MHSLLLSIAAMSTVRHYCPLFLLLVAWTLPSRVHCQEVEVDLVSTYYLQVSWFRLDRWLGVKDYHVIFMGENSNICEEDITCNTPTCTFNTLKYCGVMRPCTSTNITVSGSNYTAPSHSLVTGPEPVTDFSHIITNGVEYVWWVNPSNVTSPCYDSTAVRFSFNDKEEIIYLELGEESMSKPLCTRGYGEVEVWAEGGDGRSNSSLGTIIYNTSVVDLVTFDSCEPVECSAIGLQWSYNPLCPDVASIELELNDVKQSVSVGTTNHTVTDLTVDYEYSTCIKAVDKDGQVLDYSCYYYCRTAYEVPRNLMVTSQSSSSLKASWNPPVCKRDNDITYNVRVDYRDHFTSDTETTITDLSDFSRYEVTVYVDRGHYDNDDREISVDAFTLPRTPSLNYPDVYVDYIYVSWYFDDYNPYGYEFYYTVTWGKSLQNRETVKGNTYYNIRNYGSVEDVSQVCVVAYPYGRQDLTSGRDCQFISGQYDGDSGLSGGAIAGIVIVMLLFLVSVVACIVYLDKKSKKTNQRRLQQQQQQQQQMHQQHNHGVYNHGASM